MVKIVFTRSVKDDLIIWAGSGIIYNDCSREQWGRRLDIVGKEEELRVSF